MGLPEGITEEMLKEMSENPGVTYSGGSGTSFAPRSHVDISNRQDKGLRPQIGGHVGGRDKINSPSSDLPRRLAEGDERMKAEAKAQREREEEVRALSDPTNLNNRISYLERQLKKAVTEINKLKKANDLQTS